MKRLRLLGLILIFLFSFGIVFAQKKASGNSLNLTRIEQLVDKYISEKINGTGGETALTGLSIYYGGLSDLQKRSVCKYFMTRIDKFHSDGDMKSALVLSDLYESFSPDPTDANYARLYYIRGEYAAMRSDTLTLKRQISSLVNFSSSDETEKEKYVTALSTNLEEIRNYVPVDKTIEGTWVSDWLAIKKYNLPIFILEIKNSSEGIPVFTLRNNTGFLNWLAKPMDAQDEYAFTNDSIYVVFSNEDLKKPSPLLNGLLRTYGNTYSSIIGMKVAQNTGNSLLGDITGMASSMVVDAVSSAIFAPRKYSYILEIKLRKVNDWQMEADVAFSDVSVKGDNDPKYSNSQYHTIFTKIRKEDNWYWYEDGTTISIPFDMEKNAKKLFEKEHKCPKRYYSLREKPLGYFNRLQTLKMTYLTEERLISENIVISDSVNLHKADIQPVIGVKLDTESTALKIKDIVMAYPAERAGIEKGDIITHVDGYEVTTPQQFHALLKSKGLYKKVVLTVLHNKKKRDVTVEPCIP